MSATECDVHKKPWKDIQWQKKDEQGNPVGAPIPLRVCPERGCKERPPRAGGGGGGGGFRGTSPDDRASIERQVALKESRPAADFVMAAWLAGNGGKDEKSVPLSAAALMERYTSVWAAAFHKGVALLGEKKEGAL